MGSTAKLKKLALRSFRGSLGIRENSSCRENSNSSGGQLPPESANDEVPPHWKDPSQFGCDSARVALLQALSVLGTGQQADARFEQVTRLMASIFDTPVALVSLIDDKIAHPVPSTYWQGPPVPRHNSMCNCVLVPDTPEVIVVEDMLTDTRSLQIPFVVGEPHLRFYAGAPLVGSAGYRYGTLCILDVRRRSFPASMLNTLVNFAELVVREMERDAFASGNTKEVFKQSEHNLLRSSAIINEPIALVDLGTTGWNLLYCNEPWIREVGHTEGHIDSLRDSERALVAEDEGFWELFECMDGSGLAATTRTLQTMRPVEIHVRRKGSLGAVSGSCYVTLRPASDILAASVDVGIPGFLAYDRAVRLSSGSEDDTQGNANQPLHPWFATLHSQPTASQVPKKKVTSKKTRSTSQRRTSTDSAYKPRISAIPEGEERNNDVGSSHSSESDGSATSGFTTTVSSHTPDMPAELYPFGVVPPPRYIGKLQLGPLLGTGYSARVHRGIWDGEHVAVKIIEIPNGFDTNEKMTSALLEGSMGMSAALSHPNIVKTLDCTRFKYFPAEAVLGMSEPIDTVWLIQEICDHGRLIDAIDSGWLWKMPERNEDGIPLPPTTPDLKTILLTTRDIALALHQLHRNDVIHGDLTGKNVLLSTKGSDPRGWIARLADFGLAHHIAMPTEEIVRTHTFGTVSHMAPEVLSGTAVCTGSSDMYSLGVLLWEMWVGLRAWCNERPESIVWAVTSGDRTLPLPANMPIELQEIMAWCLVKDPVHRPTAEDIVAEVNALLAEID